MWLHRAKLSSAGRFPRLAWHRASSSRSNFHAKRSKKRQKKIRIPKGQHWCKLGWKCAHPRLFVLFWTVHLIRRFQKLTTIHTTLRFWMQNLCPGQGSDAFKLWRAIRDFLCDVPFVRPQCIYLILFAKTIVRIFKNDVCFAHHGVLGNLLRIHTAIHLITLQYNFDSLVRLKPGALANRLRTGRTCSRQLGSCTFADQLLCQCPRSRRPASLLEVSMGSPRSDQH